ncbi:MAG: Mrp/NBP35 family ATP-binding protein [Rhodospirillales bacterium]|nr:Mrp/NBP35 family ATP-binding protein [Alphaproteobacteria bacterium]MCB9981405.1 Mrp/NBP35 family ATP-binding protein [Rhodospirillales bacterium]
MLDRKDILAALKNVEDPEQGIDIVSAGMVSGVQIGADGQVLFMIEVDPQRGPVLEPLRQQAEQVVAALEGVGKVTAVLTAERAAEKMPEEKFAANDRAMDPHGVAKNPPLQLPVKKIIAVASGKGGVGKSTVAAGLARVLAAQGLKVGLLDADIYGPSQPKLMGVEGYKPALDADKQLIPAQVNGIKVMSIGFMVDAGKALVWRGPMVQSALYQLFRDVAWGSEDTPLDVLIVDMPPGTGDAQLTLAQKVPVDGAVIVSTPQDLALADARKGVEMFQAVGVPILGIVENMSTHICSACGHEEHIFGHGGARKEAEKLGVPFLGEIPLSADIRKKADAGEVFDLGDEFMGMFAAIQSG